MKKHEIDLRALYVASYRCALDLCKDVKGKVDKRFIRDNTSFVYNDCKHNVKLRNYVMSKYGDKAVK